MRPEAVRWTKWDASCSQTAGHGGREGETEGPPPLSPPPPQPLHSYHRRWLIGYVYVLHAASILVVAYCLPARGVLVWVEDKVPEWSRPSSALMVPSDRLQAWVAPVETTGSEWNGAWSHTIRMEWGLEPYVWRQRMAPVWRQAQLAQAGWLATQPWKS